MVTTSTALRLLVLQRAEGPVARASSGNQLHRQGRRKKFEPRGQRVRGQATGPLASLRRPFRRNDAHPRGANLHGVRQRCLPGETRLDAHADGEVLEPRRQPVGPNSSVSEVIQMWALS